jgi:hypothetical protein
MVRVRDLGRCGVLAAFASACAACAGLIGLDSGIAADGGVDASGAEASPSGGGVDAGGGAEDGREPPDRSETGVEAGAPSDAWIAPLDEGAGDDQAAAADSAAAFDAHAPDAGASWDAPEETSPPPAPDGGGGCAAGALDCDHDAADGCECRGEVPNGALACNADGTCGHVCDQGFVDCGGHLCGCGAGNRCRSDGTCGACRAALASCGAGTDCCSGVCGVGLTCL